ncbi:acyltransferase [Trinickia violacea]|uniref:Acyltransferase n=1 Tax=Trinickia violacea TaxID=2571746 RepID=A0A4V1EIE6_9BURK|nr:acyltransferase [Trinickia violacea]QCP53500.1 acyltransferase [Trinickia violacea]
MRPTIHPLTSLRGIAALLIVINHMTLLMLPLGVTAAKPALIKTGILGMTTFFVLSGFVMYYNYAHRISANRSEGVLHFIFARIARLYPLMIAYVLVNFALNMARSVASGDASSASLYVTTLPIYLVGMQSWFYAVINGVNVTASQYFGNPAWSVSAELFFYVLFIPLILARGNSTPSLSRGLLIVIASIAARGLFVIVSDSGTVQHWIATRLGESRSLSVYSWLVYYCPYGRCFEFFAGMGIAEIWLARRQRSVSIHADRLGLLIGMSSLLYIAVSFLSEIGISAPLLFEGTAIHFGYAASVPPAIYLLSRERGLAAKILSFAPFMLVGEISYSLYFVHTDLFPLFTVSPDTDISKHVPMIVGRCIAFLAVTLMLSALIYRTLEKPARAAVLRMFMRSGTTA